VEYSGSAPSASTSANYAVDIDAPVVGPLDFEVIDAAMRDRENLGLPTADFAPPPRLGSTAGESTPARPPTAAVGFDDGSDASIPVVPILLTILLVAGAAWGGAYLLRTRET
jgi:hypothetical protein